MGGKIQFFFQLYWINNYMTMFLELRDLSHYSNVEVKVGDFVKFATFLENMRFT